MAYSRRNFLKAAGTSAAALTAVGVDMGGTAAEAQTAPAPLGIRAPMTRETATFTINGRPQRAEYEARTTLWEVIHNKLSMTGTNRSCNRATCGACSVLLDGEAVYSCHTLATEAVGKQILTVEGLGTEANLHPIQKVGYIHMAADCGYCTAGWEVTAKGLLDKNPNPSVDQIKTALSGHICRCAAYAAIVQTVVDAGRVIRGEAEVLGQNPQSPKPKIVPTLHGVVILDQPMVRDFSTGGGHGPEQTLVEGDDKIVTKKWQGYPPENLNLIGKALPPVPEVGIPRFIGKAEYATRVVFPNMLHAKLLLCPHPRARLAKLDTSRAEKMPGVRHILTYLNTPERFAPSRDLSFQGAVVAVVAADSEDLAEDAIAAIEVEYEVLPSVATLAALMQGQGPDLRDGKGNLTINSIVGDGDTEQGFREADIVKELTYYYAGATVIPMQPLSGVARWDGDTLTMYGMGQSIHPAKDGLARQLGIPPEKVHYINKWNGGTFGAASGSAGKFYPFIAHIAKLTGRPTKIVLPKDQELGHVNFKSENRGVFKVGVKKDGRITAVERTYHINGGTGGGSAGGGEGAGGGRSEIYMHVIPNWKETGFNYASNSPAIGVARSNRQQEFKWAWEQMMDEMAEAVGMDPVKFRLLNIQKPGTRVLHSHSPWLVPMPETLNGGLTYDSYASVEVLEEGMKAIGWERRNPAPGGNPGRFKRGFGVAMSQHHAGRVGYREGEEGYKRVTEATGNFLGGGGGAPFQAVVNLNAAGELVLHFAQPESGTNHGTSMSMLVAEILGFTTLDKVRVIWGDSATAPASPGWHSGLTTQLQGGALCAAADKLRADVLARAAKTLGVDAGTLTIRDGVISPRDNAARRTTFAALAKANGGELRMEGRCVHPGSIGRALNRGIGACFAEVEVDTLTGNWRFLRAAYCSDTGKVINPLTGSGDMHGALAESTQNTTEAIPWDREFPGTRHYSVGYMSYRLPTILDVPEKTVVFINSLEPRWFYGTKGFAESTIGAPPGAIANAIYNACGVRIREHPVTRDKIMAGLKALQGAAAGRPV